MLVSSLLLCTQGSWPVVAAEHLEVEFDGVVLPVKVSDLSQWVRTGGATRSELNSWFMLLNEDSRAGLIRLLKAPVLTRRSLGQQMLRSWAAGPLLDALGELIRADGADRVRSEQVLSTFERLLQDQKSISTLDLLQALPSERLRLDLDSLVLAATRWRRQMERHQKLTTSLSRTPATPMQDVEEELSSPSFSPKRMRLPVPHRREGLPVEIWTPVRRSMKGPSSWILLMPGLGGDPDHFQWLARSLVAEGWPVAVLAHPGSDSAAVQALLKGQQPFVGADALRQRLADLNTVLIAQHSGELPVAGDQVVLIGHSLGALTALLAVGVSPVAGISERCRAALEDLPLTNLSILLQCELAASGALQTVTPPSMVKAVVGLNSFGSLIWPSSIAGTVRQPMLLLGGTLDLITPPISEQLALLTSLGHHPTSRAVIVEGASHFSPIRVEGQTGEEQGDDLFQLGEELVGVQPLTVQRLLIRELVGFLKEVDNDEPMGGSKHLRSDSVRWHRLNRGDAARLVNKNQ